MKKLIIILLLSCSVLSAQYNPYQTEPVKHEWKYKEAVKTIALYSSSIILGGIGDGLNDSGQKVAGHFCNSASIGLLVVSPFILDYNRKNAWAYLASYVSLNIGLFDISYNRARGLPIGYVGNSCLYDKFWRATKSPESWIVFKDAFFITVGFTMIINEL